MKSPVSIALFFLLSGFFLFALLAALEHSRKALAIAAACLAAVVCIIVFLTPVRLPDWVPGHTLINGDTTTTTSLVTTTVSGSTGAAPALTTTTSSPAVITWAAPTLTSTTLGATSTSGAGQ